MALSFGSLAANPLDDADSLDELMRSLISTTGMQTAWKRLDKRLAAAESGVQDSLKRLGRLPVEYVPRPEYATLVEKGHGGLLASHSSRLDDSETSLADLSKAIHQDLRQEMDGLIRGVENAYVERLKLTESFRQLEANMTERSEQTTLAFTQLRLEIKGHLEGGVVNLPQMTAAFDKSESATWQGIDDLEKRLQTFAISEDERMLSTITAPLSPSDDVTGHQEKLDSFIRQRLTNSLEKKVSTLLKLSDRTESDSRKQREDLTVQTRRVDQFMLDCRERIKMSEVRMIDGVAKRALEDDVLAIEELLKISIANLTVEVTSMQESVTRKLGEFVEHFGVVQESIEDHEHCIRHHAEELEDRGTKYDLLVFKSEVARCGARANEVEKELGQVKAEVMQSLGSWTARQKLNDASRRGQRHAKHGRSRKNASRLSTMSGLSVLSSSSRLAPPRSVIGSRDASPSSPPLLQESDGESDRGDADGEGSSSPGIRMSVVEESQGKGQNLKTNEVSEVGREDSELARRRFLMSERGFKEVAGGEEHDEDEASRDASVANVNMDDGSELSLVLGSGDAHDPRVLRDQLEVLAWATFALAHLTLREAVPAKTGESRQGRIKKQKDLLEGLHAVRQWITDKSAPIGWSPDKILSMVLVAAVDWHGAPPEDAETKSVAQPQGFENSLLHYQQQLKTGRLVSEVPKEPRKPPGPIPLTARADFFKVPTCGSDKVLVTPITTAFSKLKLGGKTPFDGLMQSARSMAVPPSPRQNLPPITRNQ